ncbi:MAG: hypothetical protein ACE5E6_12465, partial [Phycisphaerae bacterium]
GPPASWRSLVDAVAPEATQRLGAYPWYAWTDIPLPWADGVGDIGTRANAVRWDAARHDVAFLGATAEVLPAGHFNRVVARTRNKAVTLLGLVLRIVDRIMRWAPDERVRVCVDRLGGRVRYRASLATAFPDAAMGILEESDDRSAYRLTRGGRAATVEFVTSGETRHLPVALSSMYSKYLRELAMHAFNGYWAAHAPGVRPTAGYYQDARRWLADARPVLTRMRVDRGMLVRSR